MSGRPLKGQRGLTDAEAARQASRQLHEQLQAAKEAARGLDQAMRDATAWTAGLRDKVDALVDARAGSLVDKYIAEIEEYGKGLRDQVAAVREHLNGVAGMVIAAEHEVTGLPDRNKTLHVIREKIGAVAREVMAGSEFRTAIAAEVAEQIGTIIGGMKTRNALAGTGEPG